MQKIMLHILASALLVAACALEARASDGERAADRAAIQELMWRYVRALDTLDEEGYANVFTENGRFGSGRNAAEGRAALRKMVADIKKSRAEREAKGEPPSAPMYHVIANSHLEFLDANRARYHSYWMTVFGASGPDTAPRVAAVGRGVDELVRVNGRWLIESRNVAPQD